MSYLIKGNPKNVNFIHVYSTNGYTFTSATAPISPTTINFSFNSIIKPTNSNVTLSNGNVILDNKNYIIQTPLAGCTTNYNAIPLYHANIHQKWILSKNNVEIENQVFPNTLNLLGTYYAYSPASLNNIKPTNDLGFCSFVANQYDELSLKINLTTTASTSIASTLTIIFPGTTHQNTNFGYPLTSLFIWEYDL